ncbi:MAG: hypothetical protein KI790_06995 [Cyclobacteriaceae bacterium]|nr:hypothetical protein [Cyclobacteriaceae bacterium HetDA_MAG_MS6]
MKFPSLIRLPRNKRFTIEPRYYDPIKEEIEERTEKIRREMQGDQEGAFSPGRIAFERKTQSIPAGSFLQLIIAAILGLGVIGWLFYGNQIFYVLYACVPIYLYFRFKKHFSRR